MSAISDVLTGLDDVRGELEAWYRDFHAHPELGFGESRTAGLVAGRLRSWGYSVTGDVGGTGVVGILANGAGPTVLLRAEMDALAVSEATGLPYASSVVVKGEDGLERPVMHACGHDMHMSCLLGAAWLMSLAPGAWSGTLVVLFQPSEENGEGAAAMVSDGLAGLIPRPDVALAQHLLPRPAGHLGTRAGAFLSAADSWKVTLYGRGAHGSMPHAGVDPVVMAAMTVVRLQAVVSRELSPQSPAVLTVGSIQAGESANIIPETAEMKINVRTYDEATRTQVLEAVKRVVRAECEASRAPRPPLFEYLGGFGPTVNDDGATARVAEAFSRHFGDRAGRLERLTPSDDFSVIPAALGGVPYTYWGLGCVDPGLYAEAERRGTVAEDIPVNHSPRFSPVPQPTLDTGVRALVTASLAWLAPSVSVPGVVQG